MESRWSIASPDFTTREYAIDVDPDAEAPEALANPEDESREAPVPNGALRVVKCGKDDGERGTDDVHCVEDLVMWHADKVETAYHQDSQAYERLSNSLSRSTSNEKDDLPPMRIGTSGIAK